MAKFVCEVLLTDAPLAAPTERAGAETGAVVDFWGIVREGEDGKKISGIDYEAHRDMAQYQLQLIADEARARFDVGRITIQHRVGLVPVGEASLFVRVGSQHRAPGFQASMAVIDELKKRAPIWKHPVFVERKPASPSTPQPRKTESTPVSSSA